MAVNMRQDKNPMPSQDPNVRNHNFLEVALGYTEEQALDEAARCLNCKAHPCVNGCPVNVRIPEFIQKIVEKDYEGAYQVIHQTSSLPAVCGRVCPQESQCEMHCVRGKKGEAVGIGRLERFVADWHNAHSTEAPEKPQSNGHKVAVVGSGPAGLTCAGDLAKKGYDVTVYEALHLAGGVLVYGIPEFRLPKALAEKEIDSLRAMGVNILVNRVVGRFATLDDAPYVPSFIPFSTRTLAYLSAAAPARLIKSAVFSPIPLLFFRPLSPSLPISLTPSPPSSSCAV